MPTQVQKQSSESISRGLDKPYHHDQANDHPLANKHLQHKEALRLALGSILAPKRLPSSRSSSGTASPAYPSSSHSPSADGNSSVNDYYLHPRHAQYPHAHAPSRLGRSDSYSESSPSNSTNQSAAGSQRGSPLPTAARQLSEGTASSSGSPHDENGPRVHQAQSTGDSNETSTPIKPSISPLQSIQGSNSLPLPGDMLKVHSGDQCQTSAPPSGCGTPRAKFLETLQSKSAWDALIHGSFS